jgi:hypothetical protein
MLVSDNVGSAILVHHLPCEIICAIDIVDFYDRIAIASIAFPRGIVNEYNFLYARFVKHKLSSGTGTVDERFIPKYLSS